MYTKMVNYSKPRTLATKDRQATQSVKPPTFTDSLPGKDSLNTSSKSDHCPIYDKQSAASWKKVAGQKRLSRGKFQNIVSTLVLALWTRLVNLSHLSLADSYYSQRHTKTVNIAEQVA